METKRIDILLATYNPRENWLIELLDSLNRQTYPNLHLYVRDDASPNYPLERLRELLSQHVTAFPYTLLQNEQNMGSNKTFEALLSDAEGDYIAYCDQDDVWLPEKLENTLRLLTESPLSPTLVCANVRVIDGEGQEISPDMEHHRKRHVFLRGEGLAPQLFFRNYVIGCTLMMERRRALSYLPFPDRDPVHDHYLAFRASLDGAIDYLAEPQMLYRVYGGNQTGVMTGVTTKEDYYHRRIELFAARVALFESLAPDLPEIREIAAWRDARVQNYKRERGGFRALWRMRGQNKSTSLFELVALRLPTPLFRLAVRLIQKRVI